MWRYSIIYQAQPGVQNLSCEQCPEGLVKYIEFSEFPSTPLTFIIDRLEAPSSGFGLIQAHTWSSTPGSAAPPTNRIWLADIPRPGGNFPFQPTRTRRWLSLYRRNLNESTFFDAVCFRYIPETRTFLLQTF